MRLNRQEFLELYGKALQGAFANPTNGYTMWDSYARQQLMQGIAADIEITMDQIKDTEENG